MQKPVEKQKKYLIKMLRYLKEKNVQTIIVNPPLHNAFLDCIKHEKSYKEFQATLTTIAKTYNVEIFNKAHQMLIDELENEDFLDRDDLCYSGAMKFPSSFRGILIKQALDLKSRTLLTLEHLNTSFLIATLIRNHWSSFRK